MTQEAALAYACPVVLDPVQYERAANFAAYAGSPPRRKRRPAFSLSTRDERLAQCPAVAYFDREPSVVSIIAVVAAFYGLLSADLRRQCRHRPVARPRQIAMYLAMELTSFGRPKLGNLFIRDRQTIFHGHANIARLIETDAEFAADVAALRGHILRDAPARSDLDETMTAGLQKNRATARNDGPEDCASSLARL